jgi:hypothetical protein
VILCDFASDAQAFSEALPKSYDGCIRRNINPSLLSSPCTDIPAAIKVFKNDLALFEKAIAGTGILPYDFNPKYLLDFMKQLDNMNA